MAKKSSPKKTGTRKTRATRNRAKARKQQTRTAKRASSPAKRAAKVSRPGKKSARKTTGRRRSTTPRPALDRARRQLSPDERFDRASTDDRLSASARTGREELIEKLTHHTATGPDLAGGDVDASWEDAYAVGDEAPGGDNPTPDQDRVDDIGKALGVNYHPGEELEGSEKILERERHRWELDPASSDDWPHNQD